MNQSIRMALAAMLLAGGLLSASPGAGAAPAALEEASKPASETVEPEAPTVSSGAAIVMDAETGTMLYEHNAQKELPPASITKIVTAIVALEASELDEIVTVSERARYEEGTRVFLAEGERKPMELMLYGLLLNSGNDAATAIAEHIDGSKEAFAERMNEWAEEHGAKNTHFTNPHGLHGSEHYTTAEDMALLAREAMKHPMFRRIVETKTLPWDGEEWDSELMNHNKLLWRYEGATGIKNGYTSESGNTLVASAAREGRELIVALLQGESSESVYADAQALLDYGFEYVSLNPVVVKEPDPVPQPGAVDGQAEEARAAAAPSAPAKQPSGSGGWLVFFPWLVMNLFIGVAAYLQWKYRLAKRWRQTARSRPD